MSDPIVIVSAARTPMGGFMGDFAPLSCAQLGSVAIKAAVERSGLKPAQVDEVNLALVAFLIFLNQVADGVYGKTDARCPDVVAGGEPGGIADHQKRVIQVGQHRSNRQHEDHRLGKTKEPGQLFLTPNDK